MLNVEYSRYGISLKRLTEDKIDMVRCWRNDPKIQQFMDFKEYITPQMQQRWFGKINNEHNYYFIVEYQGQEIGLVNLKDIDYSEKCAEPGIFIYEDKYLNSDVGFRAALCNSDFAFEELALDYVYGHVMADNKRAKRFNRAFGYRMAEGEEDKAKQKFVLTREDYLRKRPSLQQLLRTENIRPDDTIQ